MGTRFDSFSFFDGTSMTPVTQISWADYWRGVVPDGVVANVGNEMLPYGNSTGMVVYIDTGAVMADNHRAVVNVTKALQLAAADPDYPRIDVIVARVVYGNENESYMELDVLTGTAEADPAAPEITQATGSVYEVKLAEVNVGAGVVTITANDVSDMRNVYEGGEQTRSWKNNDDEIMVKGDVVMLDLGEEGGIKKCTLNSPPLGVVTSNTIGIGQYGKIQSVAGKIAEVRCTDEAVAIGDALVASDTKGLAHAGFGYAAGVAVQPKASGLIGNVRSLLTVFTKLDIQNVWWIPAGITEANVIAAFRFSGVGSMQDALRDIATDTYTLERTANTVTWNTDGGFLIPDASTGRVGLNNSSLNGQTISAAAIRYSDFNTGTSKHASLIAISPLTYALYLKAWIRYTSSDGSTSNFWNTVINQAIGNSEVSGVALKSAAVFGGNFTQRSTIYIDGQSYVASTHSHSGGTVGFESSKAVTIGHGGYDSKWGGSAASYRVHSAVFYNTELTAAQWSELMRNMNGI